MTLEYLHPQQAENMYVHPSTAGNFPQQGTHHPPASHHQFAPADLWQIPLPHGVPSGDGGPAAAAPSHHQPIANAVSPWTTGPIPATSSAASAADWQYIHHSSTNASSVSGATTAIYSSGSEEYPNGHGQEQSYLAAGPGIQSIQQALHRPMMPYEWMTAKHSSTYRFNPQTGKTRTKDKYRVVYTDHQRLELEKEFHYSRYITIRRKSELALALGLSERQVKIWFQNRRAKERKMAKKMKIQDSQPQQQQQQQPQQQHPHSAQRDERSTQRQKDFNQNHQSHVHNHIPHHHPNNHNGHQPVLQHPSPSHVVVDTKPKLPITTMTTTASSAKTSSMSAVKVNPNNSSQHVSLAAAVASGALSPIHAMSSGAVIERSLHGSVAATTQVAKTASLQA